MIYFGRAGIMGNGIAHDPVGIRAKGVNVRRVRNAPGRETNVGDGSGWRCWRAPGFCARPLCPARTKMLPQHDHDGPVWSYS